MEAKQRSIPGTEWNKTCLVETASRATREISWPPLMLPHSVRAQRWPGCQRDGFGGAADRTPPETRAIIFLSFQTMNVPMHSHLRW